MMNLLRFVLSKIPYYTRLTNPILTKQQDAALDQLMESMYLNCSRTKEMKRVGELFPNAVIIHSVYMFGEVTNRRNHYFDASQDTSELEYHTEIRTGNDDLKFSEDLRLPKRFKGD